MRWFRNLRTATKLACAFGPVLVLLLVMMLVGVRHLSAIQDSQRALVEHDFVLAIDLLELRADLNRQRALIQQMMLTAQTADREALHRELVEHARDADALMEQLLRMPHDDLAVAAALREMDTLRREYQQTREEQIRLIQAGMIDAARDLSLGVQAARYERLRGLELSLGEAAKQAMTAALVESAEGSRRAMRTFIALAVLSVAAVVAFTWLLTALMAHPLTELSGVATAIAGGDLDVTVTADDRTDEVGVLAQSVARMTASLQAMAAVATRIAARDLRASVTPQSPHDVLGQAFARMVGDLREQIGELMSGANVLGTAATQIVASTAELASSASQSAAAVTETTTTVEEVRQTAQMSSQKAQYVYESAQRAAEISENGRTSSADAVAGMNRIRQQMEAIAASMVRLNEQTQTIGQIIASVEDLAVQSNLLAVNAAIEAAKAGEHGKGFAVVAQEVRSLAAQSRQATTEVRTILTEIQTAASAAVLATEQGSRAVDAGLRQSEIAGESIQALAGSVIDAAQAATQIAASSQQQLVGVDQVVAAMESIKQASAQNVVGAKQLESAARNLSDLGQRLKQLVQQYEI